MRRVKVVTQDDFDGGHYLLGLVITLTREEVFKLSLELSCFTTGEGFQNGAEMARAFGDLIERLDDLPEVQHG